MSKSLNQIAKSVLKLSNIFYNLSLTKLAAGEGVNQQRANESVTLIEQLIGRSLDEYIITRFQDIAEYIRISICLIRQKCEESGRQGQKYLKEFQDPEFENKCILPLIKLKEVVTLASKENGGYKEYVKLIKDLDEYIQGKEDNNIISEIIQPLINNIKFPVQGAINVIRDSDAFLSLLKAKKFNISENAELKESLTSMERKIYLGDIKIDLDKDNEDSVFYGYELEEEEGEDWESVFENEVNFGLPDDFTKQVEEIKDSLYKALKTDEGGGKEGENNAKNLANIRTLLNSLSQKVSSQIDRSKARIQTAKDKIEKLEKEYEKTEGFTRREKVRKEILVQKQIIHSYTESLNYLTQKYDTAKLLDAYDDEALQKENNAKAALTTLKEKFDEEEKEHRKNLNAAYNTRWRSESRAIELGGLTEEDYQWALSKTNDQEAISKLKKCEKTFIATRTERQKYKGQITSSFKKLMPALVSQIRNKTIEESALVAKINDVNKEREKVELLSSHWEEMERKSNAYNHEIRQSIYNINGLLSSDSLNDESIRAISRYIDDVKNLINEKPETINISPSNKKLLLQIDDLINKDSVQVSDIQQFRDRIKNGLPEFINLFEKLKTGMPSYVSEPFRQPIQHNLPRMMVNEPEKFKALMTEILNSEEAEIIKKEILAESYLAARKSKKITRSIVYKDLIGTGKEKQEREDDIKQYIKTQLKTDEALIAQDFNRELNQIVDIIYRKSEKIRDLGGAEAPKSIEIIERGKKFEKITKLVQQIYKKISKAKYQELLNDASFDAQMKDFLQSEIDPIKYPTISERKSKIEKLYFEIFKPSEITEYENKSSMMEILGKIEKAINSTSQEDLENKKTSIISSLNSPGGNFDITKQAIAWDKANMPESIFNSVLNSFKTKLKSLIGTSDLKIFYK